MAQQEDFTKKFRRYFKRIGPFRFFFSLALIFAGIGWRYLEYVLFPPMDETISPLETTGSEISFSWSSVLSFWPIFWAGAVVLSLVWWVLSGFKSATSVVVSLIAGIITTELMIPGTLFSRDELPIYFSLLGLMIFSIPSKFFHDPLVYMGFKKPKKIKHRRSTATYSISETNNEN